MLEQATARPRNYAAKQDMIREGDRPGPVFVVLEGWACRYKILPNGTRQIMAFLMPATRVIFTSGCWRKWITACRRLRLPRSR